MYKTDYSLGKREDALCQIKQLATFHLQSDTNKDVQCAVQTMAGSKRSYCPLIVLIFTIMN